jgi:hypothetical protein
MTGNGQSKRRAFKVSLIITNQVKGIAIIGTANGNKNSIVKPFFSHMPFL